MTNHHKAFFVASSLVACGVLWLLTTADHPFNRPRESLEDVRARQPRPTRPLLDERADPNHPQHGVYKILNPALTRPSPTTQELRDLYGLPAPDEGVSPK